MLQLNMLSSPQVRPQNPKLYTPLPVHPCLRNGPFSLKLNTITKKDKLAVKCRQSDYFEQQNFDTSYPSRSLPIEGGGTAGEPSSRVFVSHTIYKGKAALTVGPRAPEFVFLDSGARKLDREGFVFLQFAPALNTRQYDWSRKQVFSLSVTEIGTLIGLGPKESCDFFHDPNKGKSDEGMVRKVLKIEPLPDGSGHFFNLSVQNKLTNIDESIYIPVTKGEYAVLVSAFNYILPFLLGWHAFVDSVKLEETGRTNATSSRYARDYEWSR